MGKSKTRIAMSLDPDAGLLVKTLSGQAGISFGEFTGLITTMFQARFDREKKKLPENLRPTQVQDLIYLLIDAEEKGWAQEKLDAAIQGINDDQKDDAWE